MTEPLQTNEPSMAKAFNLIDRLLKQLEVADATIKAQEHELAEQAKLMTNLTEMLDVMTGRKKAEAEASKCKPAFKLAKNANYLQSLRIGLTEGIWFAPSSLLRIMKTPVFGLVMSVIATLGGLGFWVVSRFVVVGAGLLGRASPVKKEG